MKKLFIIIFVLLAGILLVGPFFVGSSAESQVRHMHAKLNEYPGIKVEVTDYNKGWFTSNAKINMTFDGPSNDFMPPIVFTQKLFHGPLLWEADGFGFGIADTSFGAELPEDVQKELDQIESINENTVRIATRIGFGGNMTSKVQIQPFQIEKEGNKIDVKAMDMSFGKTSDDVITGSGYWNGMSISENEQLAVNIGKMTMDTEQKLVSGEMFSPTALMAGDFKMNFDLLDIKPNSPAEAVKLENVFMTFDSALNNDLFNFSIKFGAKSINAIQQNFKELIYDLSFENFDVEVVKQLNTMMSDPAFQENPMMASAKIQGLLPQLVEKNPIVKVNKLGVITDSGEIVSDLTFKIDQQTYDPNNPMTMMFAMDADAKGQAPEAFFTNLGMGAQIEQMVQQNFIVRDNDLLKFNFSFKQGQALLNGNPVPLGGM